MKTVIIIHSCDKYNYVLPEFFRRFKQFDLHKTFPTFLTIENELFQAGDGITTLRTNLGEWSDRLAVCVDYVDADNIILFQEDFFVLNVDHTAFKNAVNFHNSMHAKITKLGSFFEFNLKGPGLFLKGTEDVKLPVYAQEGGNYIMSHQPVAIFNKKFLMETFKTPYDPWHHEIKISDAINAGEYNDEDGASPRVYTISNVHNPNRSDIITTHHAIRKGVFHPYDS